MSSEAFEYETPDLPDDVALALEKLGAEKDWRAKQFFCQASLDLLERLKPQLKGHENFWPYALDKHEKFSQLASLSSDKQALQNLTGVELKQDPKDPRPFELIFHFKENPYFSESSLAKKYVLKEGFEPAPADGSITEEMQRYDFEDLDAQATTISWKSPDMDLCAKYPRAKAADQTGDNEDFEGDFGSFFLYFTTKGDPYAIGPMFVDEILPDIIDYFTGDSDQDGSLEIDEEDELDEDGGSDEEDIDLEAEEAPALKKRKTQS